MNLSVCRALSCALILASLPACMLPGQQGAYGRSNLNKSAGTKGGGSLGNGTLGDTGGGDGTTTGQVSNPGKILTLTKTQIAGLSQNFKDYLAADTGNTVMLLDMSQPMSLVNDADRLYLRQWGPFDNPDQFITSLDNISCTNSDAVSTISSGGKNFPVTSTFIDESKFAAKTLIVPLSGTADYAHRTAKKGKYYIEAFCVGYPNPNMNPTPATLSNTLFLSDQNVQVFLTGDDRTSDGTTQVDTTKITAVKKNTNYFSSSTCKKDSDGRFSRKLSLSLKSGGAYGFAGQHIYTSTDPQTANDAVSFRYALDASGGDLKFIDGSASVDAAGGATLMKDGKTWDSANRDIQASAPTSAAAILTALRTAGSEFQIDFATNPSRSNDASNNKAPNSIFFNFDLTGNPQSLHQFSSGATKLRLAVEIRIKSRLDATTSAAISAVAGFSESKDIGSFQDYYNALTDPEGSGDETTLVDKFDYIRLFENVTTDNTGANKCP